LHRALSAEPGRPLSKAYLRRIADTAWIDQHRKSGPIAVTGADLQSEYGAADGQLDVREALEHMADRLNARQMTLIVLVDLFRFTAKEAAELIRSTEGAVKEGLKRARLRLRQPDKPRVPAAPRGAGQDAQPAVTTDLFESFLNGFRSANPYAIARAFLSLTANGLETVAIRHADQVLYFTFSDPDGHLLSFSAPFSG